MSNNKFETCKYRDPDTCIKGVGCCSNKEIVRYECSYCIHPELLIVDLQPEACEDCIFYEGKDERDGRD